jgi:hypothetical protein
VLLLVYRRNDSKDDNKKEHFVTGSACVPKWSIRKGADSDARDRRIQATLDASLGNEMPIAERGNAARDRQEGNVLRLR